MWQAWDEMQLSLCRRSSTTLELVVLGMISDCAFPSLTQPSLEDRQEFAWQPAGTDLCRRAREV